MALDLSFFLTAAALGAGLAMDAFSVALADGLAEPRMPGGKLAGIAACFALMQGVMPLLGWVGVHVAVGLLRGLGRLIPWIALALLGGIGANMIAEAVREWRHPALPGRACHSVSRGTVLLQGLATSLDALSVGLTLEGYMLPGVLLAVLMIAMITLAVCAGGLWLGRRGSQRLCWRAELAGGLLLIGVGCHLLLHAL